MKEGELNLIFDYIDNPNNKELADKALHLIDTNKEAKEIYDDHLLTKKIFKTEFKPKFEKIGKYQLQSKKNNIQDFRSKLQNKKNFWKGAILGFVPPGIILSLLLTSSFSSLSFRSVEKKIDTDEFINQIKLLDYLPIDQQAYPIDLGNTKYSAIKKSSEFIGEMICFKSNLLNNKNENIYELIICNNNNNYEIHNIQKIRN